MAQPERRGESICGRDCEADFQTAPVKYVRSLLQAGVITPDGLKGTQRAGFSLPQVKSNLLIGKPRPLHR